MNLPFLRQLPGIGRRPLLRIVAEPAAKGTGAEAALQHLLTELPELLMMAVVTAEAGQVLASYTTQPELWPSGAALAWASVIRQLHAAAASSDPEQPTPPQLEEILTTLPTQLHLLRLRPGGSHFLYLVVDIHDTNLALARELMRQAIDLLTVI